MTDDAPDKPIFGIDLGRDGGTLAPTTIAALKEWLTAERNAWQWLWEEPVEQRGEVQPLTAQINDRHANFNRLADHAAEQLEAEDTVGAKDTIASLEEAIRSAYEGPLIPSASPLHPLLKRLAEAGEWKQLQGVLHFGINQSINTNDMEHFGGVVSAVLAVSGMDSATTADQQHVLADLAQTFQASSAECKASMNEFADRTSRLNKQANATVDRGVRALAHQVRRGRDDAAKQRGEAQEHWKALEQTYNAALALQKPVEYWRGRQKVNRGLALAFYTIFIILLGVVAWMSAEHGESVPWDQVVKTNGAWSLGGVALVLAGVGLVVALLRVPLRLGASFLHLANDSAERVTMVTTYLALREGGHASDAQMQTVIERLFLPAHDGIVKDDLQGVTMQDLLSRLKR